MTTQLGFWPAAMEECNSVIQGISSRMLKASQVRQDAAHSNVAVPRVQRGHNYQYLDKLHKQIIMKF